MKRAVRIFGWLFLCLGVVALLVTLFFWYRQIRSQSQHVPAAAEAIIEIRTDKLIRELAGNALWNPRAYFAADRDTSVDSTFQGLRPWNLGVSLPANIYFFRLPANEQTYFAYLPISDVDRLQDVFRQKLHFSVAAHSADSWAAYPENKRWYVLANGDQLLLAWNPDRTDAVAETMEKLLQEQTDLVKISTFKNTTYQFITGAVNYWHTTETNYLSVDFQRGEVVLSGQLADSSWRFNQNPTGPVFPEDNILSIRLNADIRPWLARHHGFLEKQGVSWQEIAPNIGNYWEMQWRNETVLQADTIITYDYDENFEMIEKRELKNESVPWLRFSFMGSPHLLSYLPEKLFYKFYQQQVGSLLVLSTTQDTPRGVEPMPSQKNPLLIQYRRPDELRASIPLPRWLNAIQRADLTGDHHQEDTKALKLSGHLVFRDSALHPLKQWADR